MLASLFADDQPCVRLEPDQYRAASRLPLATDPAPRRGKPGSPQRAVTAPAAFLNPELHPAPLPTPAALPPVPLMKRHASHIFRAERRQTAQVSCLPVTFV